MDNYKDKLSQIKGWRRAWFTVVVTYILTKEYLSERKPADMVAPASMLLVINILVMLGLRGSIFGFILNTLIIIALATSPMLFQSTQAHWVGANGAGKYFNDFIVFSALQLVLSIQAYTLTKGNAESFLILLFVSFLASLISLYVFKSYIWVRLSRSST